ncbi:MAG: ParB/RepB/Spo0J family partition protein [Oscillospiraceae bacterium]|nr:ParB/RepB/Spo0J family partition protein [Oscillospiraceae bacterium]
MAKLKLNSAIMDDLKAAASDSFIDSLKMLEVEDIIPNESNFYEMTEIEELAEDIERQGLMSVLVVTEDNGEFHLISGHRRLAAVKLLIGEGRRKSTTVPCYIKSAKSADETQLDLIMLNATQRKYSDSDTMREYEELERIFKAMEQAGKPVKGKIRNNIARVLNVSPAQIGKIDNIKHNAIPDVEQAVKSGEMSISTANEVAKLAPEQQKEIIENKPDITHKEVKEIQKTSPKPPKPKKKEPEKVAPPPVGDEDITESAENTSEVDDNTNDDSVSQISEPTAIEDAPASCEPLILSETETIALAKYAKAILLAVRDEDYDIIKGITDRLVTA